MKLYKALFFICSLLLTINVFAQPPCFQDSIGIGQNTVYEMDTIAPPCWEFCESSFDSCHFIRLPDSIGSAVVEFKDLGGEFEIVVLASCRWVVHDTCAIIENQTPGFVLFNEFPPITTIMVCGQGSSNLSMMVSQLSGLPPFGDTLADCDTLCGPFVGIDSPKIEPAWDYFLPHSLKKVDVLEPNTYYLQRKKIL